MRIKELFQDDDAVSPVIGVILMVAITVILAAVIASFVLGLGDTADEVQPTTSFNFDYDDSDHNLTITISDGDSIEAENLHIRGEMNASNDGGDPDPEDVNTDWSVADDTTFGDDNFIANSTGGFDGDGEISSGQGIVISSYDDVDDHVAPYDINVVWDTGDDSSTLDSDERDG